MGPYGLIYGLTLVKMEVLQKEVEENLTKSFFKSLTSLVGAPILFVKKKDKRLRFYIDYKGLNWITVKNPYTLPLIGELIDRLKEACYFTSLVLKTTYNLARIVPGKEWKMAFRCRFRHYKYRVMPFELTNALAFFQALINDTLYSYPNRFTCAYLDNIIVYLKNLQKHVSHVCKALK